MISEIIDGLEYFVGRGVEKLDRISKTVRQDAIYRFVSDRADWWEAGGRSD